MIKPKITALVRLPSISACRFLINFREVYFWIHSSVQIDLIKNFMSTVARYQLVQVERSDSSKLFKKLDQLRMT